MTTTTTQPTVIDGIAGLLASVGQHLGYSDWHTMTQQEVNAFANVTGDHQFIHVDPAAAAKTIFGGTIAHGYLTLSLGPALAPAIYNVTGLTMGVNYGTDRVRFPAPLPVGSRYRMGVDVKSVDILDGGGAQVVYVHTFEVEGGKKPCCVAEIIVRVYE